MIATAYRLKPGREITTRGGYGVARQLRAMRTDAGVYWSTPHANWYVVVQESDATFRVLSINGIGEIRWSIDPMDLGWTGDSSARAAVDYFLDAVEMSVDEQLQTLRRAGYKPYATMRILGRDLEVISLPFPKDDGTVGLMVREPNDPTTMVEWTVPEHVVRLAIASFGGVR